MILFANLTYNGRPNWASWLHTVSENTNLNDAIIAYDSYFVV